jgi:5-methylcytosine-specific restriction endonuclease McrA
MNWGQVLLLDVAFKPVRLINRRRAVKLIYLDKASEIIPDKVVQLKNFLMKKPFPLKYSKRSIFIRDAYTCQYCGASLSHSKATIDHIVPRYRGGKSSFGNCVTACARCNTEKGHKPLAELKNKLRVAPYHPTHSDIVQNQSPELWGTFQHWLHTVCN